MTEDGHIRILLVDDSAVVRGLIKSALRAEPTIEIAATAVDGQMAVDVLKRTPVDVIILDIEMPVMDGLTALPLLLEIAPKVKIIMASTLTLRNAEISMRALQLGATDYLAKPTSEDRESLPEFYRLLIDKIKTLGGVRKTVSHAAPVAAPISTLAIVKPKPTIMPSNHTAIPSGTITDLGEALRVVPFSSAVAIASSTGGPQALITLFTALKNKIAHVPIFITQHMPPNFTTILADHLGKASGAECHEAKSGEVVRNGVIYIAPGDYHMTVERQPGGVTLKLDQNAPENFCRPAADPMLRSLATVYGSKLFVAVLTGMGADGAKGSAEVVQSGGMVLAQDEASCVVYGMPKAVVDAKLARMVLPLPQIAPCLARAMGA